MKNLFFGICASVLASTVPAWGAVYECNVDQMAINLGYLPQVVVLQHSGEEAKVNDPIIMHFKGQPIEAEVAVDNDKRVTVSWRIKIKNDRNEHINMSYRLTIMKAGLRANMTAQPFPYDNQFAAQGSCKKVKG